MPRGHGFLCSIKCSPYQVAPSATITKSTCSHQEKIGFRTEIELILYSYVMQTPMAHLEDWFYPGTIEPVNG